MLGYPRFARNEGVHAYSSPYRISIVRLLSLFCPFLPSMLSRDKVLAQAWGFRHKRSLAEPPEKKQNKHVEIVHQKAWQGLDCRV